MSRDPPRSIHHDLGSEENDVLQRNCSVPQRFVAKAALRGVGS